jgi:hypothetical protein
LRIITPFDKTSSLEKFDGFITPKPFMSTYGGELVLGFNSIGLSNPNIGGKEN